MTTTHTQPAGCDLDSLAQRLRAQCSAPFGPEGFSLLCEAADVMRNLARAAQAPTGLQDEQGLADEGLDYLLQYIPVPAARVAAQCKVAELRAAQAPQGDTRQGAPDDRIGAYKPGSWFDALTIDEMQAFYLSRLPAICEAAREHGYAVGLHGSTRRDFDLMAMQWREGASDKDTLARAIADAACGIRREGVYDWETKPHGRVATSIPICWTDHANPDFDNMVSAGHIDLSVIDSRAAIAHSAAQAPKGDTRQGAAIALPVDLIHDFRDAIAVARHRAKHDGDTASKKRWIEVASRLDGYARSIATPAAPACTGCDPAEGFCRDCREAERKAAHTCTPADEQALPPLPIWDWQDESAIDRTGTMHFYTGDSMRAYARAAQGAGTAPTDTLRKSVRAIVQLVRDGEWADLLDMDDDAAALWGAVDGLLRRGAGNAPACKHEFHYFGDQVSARRCLHCNKLEDAQGAGTAPVGVSNPAAWLDRDGHMVKELREFIEGMSVSMDVSTGDHDAGHRYFGIINEVMDDYYDKNGVTLLVYDAQPNFAAHPAPVSTAPSKSPEFEGIGDVPVSTAAATTASASGGDTSRNLAQRFRAIAEDWSSFTFSPVSKEELLAAADAMDATPSRAADGQQGTSRAALDELIAALRPSTPAVYAPVQGAAYRHGYKDAVRAATTLARNLPAQGAAQVEVEAARDAVLEEAANVCKPGLIDAATAYEIAAIRKCAEAIRVLKSDRAALAAKRGGASDA